MVRRSLEAETGTSLEIQLTFRKKVRDEPRPLQLGEPNGMNGMEEQKDQRGFSQEFHAGPFSASDLGQ
jgi:hypothetical protein